MLKESSISVAYMLKIRINLQHAVNRCSDVENILNDKIRYYDELARS